ncbi:MAG: hypothetical protein WCO99_05225 [Planctomycetota bacterium]
MPPDRPATGLVARDGVHNVTPRRPKTKAMRAKTEAVTAALALEHPLT